MSFVLLQTETLPNQSLVAYSDDGFTYVYSNQSLNVDRGRVYVRRYNLLTSSWYDLSGGAALVGTTPSSGLDPGDRFGNLFSLSSDGNRLLVRSRKSDRGRIDIFDWNNTTSTWSNIFNVEGANLNVRLGSDFAVISPDGNHFAIGSTANDNSQSVHIYSFRNGNWTNTLFLLNTRVNSSTVFSNDGNTFFLGNTGSVSNPGDGWRFNVGQVRVWRYNQINNNWSERTIISNPDNNDSDFFGFRIKCSSNGNVIAISAPGADITGRTNCGKVYIYTTSNNWTSNTRRDIIVGNNANSGLGNCGIDLSSDGTMLAIGSATFNSTEPLGSGSSAYSEVRLLSYVNSSWQSLSIPSSLSWTFTSGARFYYGNYLKIYNNNNNLLVGKNLSGSYTNYRVSNTVETHGILNSTALVAAGFTASRLRTNNFSAGQLKNAGFTATELRNASFTLSQLKSAEYTASELKTAGYTASELKFASFTASELKIAEFTASELKTASFTVSELKTASFTASELKVAGFTASELKLSGFTASELKLAEFTALELKSVGFTSNELISAGFNASELNTAGYSLTELITFGYNATELKSAGFSATELKNNNFTATQLKVAGFTASELKSAGFTATELKTATFTVSELKFASFTASELKIAGFTVSELKFASFTASELKSASFTVIELKSASFTATELKVAEFTATELKSAGFTASELKIATFTAIELKNASFTINELKIAEFTAIELKVAGFTANELKTAEFTATQLKSAGFTASELKNVNFTLSELKIAGYTATELKVAEFTASELKVAGYTATELKVAEFTASELKVAGFTASELTLAGFTASELKYVGFTASQLKIAGFTASQLKFAGFTAIELKSASFSASQLRVAGFTASELKVAEFTASQLKVASFTATELKTAEFTATQLKAAGFSANELKVAGFTTSELKVAGFSANELKVAGFSANELKVAGFTANELKHTGFTLTQLKEGEFILAELQSLFSLVDLKTVFTSQELINGFVINNLLLEINIGSFNWAQSKLENKTISDLLISLKNIYSDVINLDDLFWKCIIYEYYDIGLNSYQPILIHSISINEVINVNNSNFKCYLEDTYGFYVNNNNQNVNLENITEEIKSSILNILKTQLTIDESNYAIFNNIPILPQNLPTIQELLVLGTPNTIIPSPTNTAQEVLSQLNINTTKLLYPESVSTNKIEIITNAVIIAYSEEVPKESLEINILTFIDTIYPNTSENLEELHSIAKAVYAEVGLTPSPENIITNYNKFKYVEVESIDTVLSEKVQNINWNEAKKDTISVDNMVSALKNVFINAKNINNRSKKSNNKDVLSRNTGEEIDDLLWGFIVYENYDISLNSYVPKQERSNNLIDLIENESNLNCYVENAFGYKVKVPYESLKYIKGVFEKYLDEENKPYYLLVNNLPNYNFEAKLPTYNDTFMIQAHVPFDINYDLSLNVRNIEYTSESGNAYGIGTGFTGTLLMYDLTAELITEVHDNRNYKNKKNSRFFINPGTTTTIKTPASNFITNPVIKSIKVPNAPTITKTVNGSTVTVPTETLIINKLNTSTGTLVDQYPYPITALFNGVKQTYDFQTTTLSTFIVTDPNAPSGSAGGDPHIQTINGVHTLLPNDWKLVKLYQHNYVKVIVKCEHINDEVIEKLHKFDERRNIISINKDVHKYVANLTYMSELIVLRDNDVLFKIDLLNDKILLHNEQDSHVKLEKLLNDEGLFSLTHKRVYPKQNLSSYLLHLDSNNVMKVQIDNFWDDINFVKLHLFDKEHIEEYSGEFFKHDEVNRLE